MPDQPGHILDAAKGNMFSGAPSFSLRHRALRAAFSLVWLLLARWTPPPMHRWRILVLNIFGARVDSSARIYGSTRVWYPPNLTMAAQSVMGPEVICFCMAEIALGRRAVVSQRAHLCAGTHAVNDPNFQLQAGPIIIGDKAWIAAEAFIGPGVTVGEGAVLGARAVTMKKINPWAICVGNPAQLIKYRDRF